VPDLPCIKAAGIGIGEVDAHPLLWNGADYITFTRGGFGAVRKVCDLIMQSQDTLSNATGASI
jgi:3-deoxy-D-manno-octulosonate 8-phosphate phosphatase (KDO 8-P phosphatase)